MHLARPDRTRHRLRPPSPHSCPTGQVEAESVITSLDQAKRSMLSSEVHHALETQGLWRDFGINPLAMGKRLLIERVPEPGSPLKDGVKVAPLVADALLGQMRQAIAGAADLASLEKNLTIVAKEGGLDVQCQTGLPRVNWSEQDPTLLQIRHQGGAAAHHEMVHVVQCVIGGVCALQSKQLENFQSLRGRPPNDILELKAFAESHPLSLTEKQQAMEQVVNPMETGAYCKFEETAFHASGMSGKRSKDFALYQSRLGEVAEGFVSAYRQAQVPAVRTDLDARIYGTIGHVARTHGETAAVLGGAAIGYVALTRTAMRVHPMLALPMAGPLGYLLYRSLVSG